MIAAIALANGLPLYTCNPNDFASIDDLEVVPVPLPDVSTHCKRPIPDSYWLIDGRVLAGEYPGTPDPETTREKLAKFLDVGILTFVDLTETNEGLADYADILRTLAGDRGLDVKHIRIAIRDQDVPTDRTVMTRILATMRGELHAGRPVYVHCWGGIGRTGMVIGCWLVEKGIAGPAAIEKLAELREGTPDGQRPSPETDDQRRYICDWHADE
jgi:protein-tyrosine phosphatase